MKTGWDSYWPSFLLENKLRGIVDEIDSVSGTLSTEEICKGIYEGYDEYALRLESIRFDLMKDIDGIPGVHLQTSRVKNIDSLLRKVITKRHDWMMDSKNRYSSLRSDNYNRVITDMIGIRLIISYRGSWKELHHAIIDLFPYKEQNEYHEDQLIPLNDKTNFIAEIPHAYYAYGDDISAFDGENVVPKIKDSGYRSIHYTVCYKGVYVELQTRTIYDEAWSDCDHLYVYKHEENVSHGALVELSQILCSYTNTSNDFGDLMKDIFDHNLILSEGGKFVAVDDTPLIALDKLIRRYGESQKVLTDFRANLQRRKDGVPGE